MEQKKILYAVMRLNETVEVDYFGQTRHVKVSGIRGFIPVFETIEEAMEHSKNGKYQIIGMSV